MTVTEYRRKYPDCKYCQNRLPGFEICDATNKTIIFGKRRAKNVLVMFLKNGCMKV